MSLDFEIFGKVQGVFFRKHTKATADKLKLVGCVENTETGVVATEVATDAARRARAFSGHAFCVWFDVSGSVRGTMQGPVAAVEQMKEWLTTKGSPKSVIEDARFSPARRITAVQFRDFKIRR